MDRTRPDGTPLRTGYTTGANACAAACAATRLLVGLELEPWEGPLPELTADRYDTLAGSVRITLPNGEAVRFPVRVAERRDDAAWASVIKDGGDDPDCTHRAEHWAEVRLRDDGVVELHGGRGVGTVTKPGLGLPVGGPAINPVPRQNITEEVAKLAPGGADVIIGITDGEELAKKTLNARLGIVGGLSVLGTTGIVHPYSTAAFRASVAQGIDVARNLGAQHVVLTTGGRSERFAMELLPDLPEPAFVQMGDFCGYALNHAASVGMRGATIVGMIGKLSKMADGRTMTHAAGSEVNTALLAEVARGVGADDALCDAIAAANTGRHVQELVAVAGLPGFFDALCERVSVVLSAHVKSPIRIDVFLVDFSGPALGRYPHV
ncbi:MAG: cobalt-precorrin-5B (C(1))-methyltransferase [Myxococcota bacterium]